MGITLLLCFHIGKAQSIKSTSTKTPTVIVSPELNQTPQQKTTRIDSTKLPSTGKKMPIRQKRKPGATIIHRKLQ